MGYFPPALLSFNAPADFFNNSGKLAPLTRINIEMPRELIEDADPGENAPYTLQQIPQEQLVAIQTAVMREYGSVARQCLNAFRQGRDLSDLAIVNRRGMLDAGVGMNYVSQFGREIININVSPDAVRKLLGSTEQGLYMLVLYGSNQIAYVPMASIASPVGKVTKKTLSQSGWATPSWYSLRYATRCYRIKMCQVKISSEFNALSGIFKINNSGVITIPSVADQTPMFNVSDTLLRSAESSTPFSDLWGIPAQWDDFGGSGDSTEYVNVIINGSGKTVWNDRGNKFVWTAKDGVVRESIGEIVTSVKGEYTTYYAAKSPVVGINSDGNRFTDIVAEVLPFTYYFGLFTNFPIVSAQVSAASSYGGKLNFIISYGPGDSEVHFDGWNGDGGSASGKARVAVYEKSANLDMIKMGESTPTASGLRLEDSGEYIGNFSNYFGYDVSLNSVTQMGTSVRSVIPFPPSLGTEKSKVYFYNADSTEYGVNNNINGFIQTPYGRHDYSGKLWSFWFDPWLHASNGKHVLQGYDWTEEGKLWLDGVDYGDTLANAIGCEFDDLKAVILDVKMSDIIKLK